MATTDDLPPGQKRMNVVLSTWAHRELKMAAARDLVTMKLVLISAVHHFYDMDEAERKRLYSEVTKLNDAEVKTFSTQ